MKLSKHIWIIGCITGILLVSLWGLYGCEKSFDTEHKFVKSNYITENIIVVVVDGPRFSESWGDPERRYIPYLSTRLKEKGVFNQEFYNFGNTKTVSGHTVLMTGVYELMNNNGIQYPSYPSFMQYWLKKTNSSPDKAWVISAKKKLAMLGNSSNLDWRNTYIPAMDAVDRSDIDTYLRVKDVMETYTPNLIFINLSGPDRAGHQNKWNDYVNNIKECDSLLNNIVNLVDSMPEYAGKTTVFMTNDHGRHLEGIASGFIDHGDLCHGCTHIHLFAYGPDFKSNAVITNQSREQTDLVPTIGKLLGIEMNQSTGKVMTELFKE